MAEFDAAEADMAQVQTRPVDAVRAEEEELLESSKPARPSRERQYQYPSKDRLATGGISKVESSDIVRSLTTSSLNSLRKSLQTEWKK